MPSHAANEEVKKLWALVNPGPFLVENKCGAELNTAIFHYFTDDFPHMYQNQVR